MVEIKAEHKFRDKTCAKKVPAEYKKLERT